MNIESMRAVRIQFNGGLDALVVEQVPRPVALGNQIRVRVHAAALNRADILQRRGLYPAPVGWPADIPGLEFAGEVEQVGDKVSRWRIGQRVFGIAGGGAQAEYLVIPESAVVEMPALEWVEGAAIPEAFITAHDALITQAGLSTSENVLVHAAGSGVGLAAIQIAHAVGANVYGTARSAEKIERARSFGLQDGVVVEDDPYLFAMAASEWTGQAGMNVILDLVGGSYLAANLKAIAARGRLMLVGTMGGASGLLDLRMALSKRVKIIGTVLRSRSEAEKASAVSAFARDVVPLLERGVARAVVDSTYAMKDVREAHQRMESNESFGKIVLLIAND